MKSCLVVDDSRVIRNVTRRILEDLHFVTEEAEDGVAALAVCRQNMPDVILVDWNMPNMNGIDFLRNLRRERGGEKPVVLFCTTENSAESINEAISAGANEYILKPFDRGLIEAKLTQIGML